MKVLELFAGTRSIGKAFEAHGHQVFSVEWDKSFENIDLYEDVLKVTPEEIVKRFGRPDVIWASPDCTTYSIAAISHHRKRGGGQNLDAVSEYAQFCDRVNLHVHNLIMWPCRLPGGSSRTRAEVCGRWTSCPAFRGTPLHIASTATPA